MGILSIHWHTLDTFVTRDTCTPDTMALLGPSRDRPSLGVGGIGCMAVWTAWNGMDDAGKTTLAPRVSAFAAAQRLSVSASRTSPPPATNSISQASCSHAPGSMASCTTSSWKWQKHRQPSSAKLSSCCPDTFSFYLYTHTLFPHTLFPAHIHHQLRPDRAEQTSTTPPLL